MKINRLADISPVISCDRHTAKHYGKIKNYLKVKGLPIPENDLWIAALTEQHRLTLVTRDKHFKHIKTIDLVEW